MRESLEPSRAEPSQGTGSPPPPPPPPRSSAAAALSSLVFFFLLLLFRFYWCGSRKWAEQRPLDRMIYRSTVVSLRRVSELILLTTTTTTTRKDEEKKTKFHSNEKEMNEWIASVVVDMFKQHNPKTFSSSWWSWHDSHGASHRRHGPMPQGTKWQQQQDANVIFRVAPLLRSWSKMETNRRRDKTRIANNNKNQGRDGRAFCQTSDSIMAFPGSLHQFLLPFTKTEERQMQLQWACRCAIE